MNTPPPARSRHPRGSAVTAVGAVVALLLTGCTGSGGDSADSTAGKAGNARFKVALVTHGAKGDEFWARVQKGAEDAAAKDGITLTYASDPDASGQAELVRDALKDGVDGIALTLAKPEAMRGPINDAITAGIPVVGVNSGINDWKSDGALEYFGQDESVAGRAVGDKLDALNVRHALCVIHERGNVALEARCAGVKKSFGGQTEILYVDGTDMNAMTQAVATRLKQDPTIDEVVTNGAQFALAAVKSVHKAGAKTHVATFDLNSDLVKAVQDGDVQFAVDQQPYMQGYLAVDALWLYHTNGNVSGGGVAPVLTGPAFVTKTNVASVAKFAAGGTR